MDILTIAAIIAFLALAAIIFLIVRNNSLKHEMRARQSAFDATKAALEDSRESQIAALTQSHEAQIAALKESHESIR